MRRSAVALSVASSLLVLAGACTLVGGPAPSGRAPAPAEPAARPTRRVQEPSARRPVFSPVRTFPEVRGLWVVRFTMTSEAAVREMVANAAEAGFNTLIVQIRGRGDAYYQSRWEPMAEGVTGGSGVDPLAVAIREAHARGLAVHAWVNTHLVWDSGPLPVSPEHIVRRHPDWLAVPEDLGRELARVDPRDPRFVGTLMRHAEENLERVEGIYTSPSHPAVQERVYSIWMDLADRYDLDGLHFDYVRFPSPAYDYSAGALSRFRTWVAPRLSEERLARLDAEARTDPYALVAALPGPWDEFRRAQIDGLVARVYHGIKARRPELVVSAAVVPDQTDAYENRFQDWPRWLAEGILDVAVPMTYTADDRVYREQVAAARAAAGADERLWAGVGIYQNSFASALAKIDLARSQGAGGVVLFSYDWAVTEGSNGQTAPYLERLGEAAFRR